MTRAFERGLSQFRKNYIVNGAMMVSQENGAAAISVSGNFPVDQFWILNGSSGALTAQQVSSPSPAGSPNRVRITVTTADASVVATKYVRFEQILEGLRIADLRSGSTFAKTICLQFGVKAPAGTYGVSVRGGGGRSYVGEYVIAAGEANTDVVKLVTLQLDQSGTWATDNTGAMSIAWCLMAGSNFQQSGGSWQPNASAMGTANQFNFMGTNGNVFELFDVGLYEGSSAPAFQVPDFASELQLCQRYWEKSYDYGVAPGVITEVGDTSGVYSSAAGTQSITGFFKNTKRATPTMTLYDPASGGSGACRNAGVGSVTVQVSAGVTSFTFGSSSASSGAYLRAQWSANARM